MEFFAIKITWLLSMGWKYNLATRLVRTTILVELYRALFLYQMQTNILLGAEATSSMDPQKIQLFFESSKQKVPSVRALRNASLEKCEGFSPVGKLEMSSLVDNFDITAWLIHRLSKLQMMKQQGPPSALPS
jgi:hypothetical protein